MPWPEQEKLKAEKSWFARAVDQLLADWGGSVHSGRRSVARNKAVGGVPDSLHLDGLAADVVFESHAEKEAVKNSCKSRGLHWHESPGLNLHIQARPSRANEEARRRDAANRLAFYILSGNSASDLDTLTDAILRWEEIQ